MSSFVLVHGGWHGGWCWRRVARRLREQGHEVFTPTLTGLGERSHLLSHAINLDTHVEDVLGVLDWEDLDDVVLVGHSYGGLVVTGAADRRPERIAALVFLDAFIGEDGESLLTLTSDDFRPFLLDGAGRNGGLLVPPVSAAQFNVGPEDQAWVDGKCGLHPFACFLQRQSLTGAWHGIRRKASLLATGWSPNPLAGRFEALRGDPGWITIEMECGHDMMVDRPGDVADWLAGLAP
ncbi:MAG: alpha/beta fold hydrolase [Alphaproteobacteria bacterium]|nr:alpha/beta fold hydrolase [Alphaproteobacteria bacterium]